MPGEKTHLRFVPPAQTPARGSSAATTLPDDLLLQAGKRLAWLAVMCLSSTIAVRSYEQILQPIDHQPAARLFTDVCLLGLTVFSGWLLFRYWRGRADPRNHPRIAVAYGLAGALAISIFENAAAWPEDQMVRGVSWNTAWILAVTLAVPQRPRVAAAVSFAMALMGPVGLGLHVLAGSIPAPSAAQRFLIFVPNFICALWAALLSNMIYRLNRDVAVARELGSYRLVERLGAGGMGEVWRAEHHLLTRPAAIKLIQASRICRDPAAMESAMARFEREARLTATLRSPHTVQIFDFGVADDGRLYYVMELLEGITLEQLVSEHGAQPAGRVIHFLSQACQSIAEAHQYALLHRDLKPGNLIACRLGLEYDFTKVLDFGLVKSLDDRAHTQLSVEGQFTGTPAYMAPEAISGGRVDTRSDIYSLGCVAYWLLTGRLVFEGPTAVAVALAHLQQEPRPPSEVGVAPVPPDLERLVLDCLAKNPDDRPVSAFELLERLARCQDAGSWAAAHAERWWMMHRPAVVAGTAPRARRAVR